MMTFDGWDARFCGDAMALPGDSLMHFRTRGSKNGIRRYQQEDGTWTPLGLRMRKEREGWGETRKERRAEKRVQRAEKKIAKAERKIEKKAEEKEGLIRRTKRKENVSSLSDEELRRKIQRAKMEAEYNEITKSPALKTGERVFSMIMSSMEKAGDRKFAREQMALERLKVNADMARTNANIVQSKQQTKQAEAGATKARMEARKARMDARKMRQDRKAGLEKEREAHRLQAEESLKELTFWGSHRKLKNARKMAQIEDSKSINAGTKFVRSLAKSAKIAKKNKLNVSLDRYENEHKNRDALKTQKELTEQAKARAELEAKKAEQNYWAWKIAGRKGNKGGKP